MSEDTNIVLTADVNGYTQGMQQAAVETNKTNKALKQQQKKKKNTNDPNHTLNLASSRRKHKKE